MCQWNASPLPRVNCSYKRWTAQHLLLVDSDAVDKGPDGVGPLSNSAGKADRSRSDTGPTQWLQTSARSERSGTGAVRNPAIVVMTREGGGKEKTCPANGRIWHDSKNGCRVDAVATSCSKHP